LPIFGILCNRCFQMPYSSLSFCCTRSHCFSKLTRALHEKTISARLLLAIFGDLNVVQLDIE
jgi:hypothetical protein